METVNRFKGLAVLLGLGMGVASALTLAITFYVCVLSGHTLTLTTNNYGEGIIEGVVLMPFIVGSTLFSLIWYIRGVSYK